MTTRTTNIALAYGAYAADADPSAMALIIAGAAGNALANAKRMLEEN